MLLFRDLKCKVVHAEVETEVVAVVVAETAAAVKVVVEPLVEGEKVEEEKA